MSGERFRIVVAEKMAPYALERLREAGEVVELSECDEASLQSAVKDCDALVVRSYSQVTASVIQTASGLKVIGRAGIGVDNIDTAAALAAGIRVVHTPAASTQAVAELTVGLILALERKIFWGDKQLREGKFLQARGRLANRQLGEMTLGVIGFGRIGQRVAEIVHSAFGMRILFNDIREIRTNLVPACAASKNEVYERADVLSLHVPLTTETKHLIDSEALSKMKEGALLINTARGAVVDAEALASALLAGRIAGAVVDVFDPEPPPPDHPLLSAPNCILTPHIGSRTESALASMNDVVDDVIAVLQNRPPQYPFQPSSV